MAQLRHDYQEFVQRQAEVITVAPDARAALTDYWHKQKLPFIGLSDPKHEVANLYGQRVMLLKFGRMPSLFVIDKSGRVRFSHYADRASDIPENTTVLGTLDDLNKEEQR